MPRKKRKRSLTPRVKRMGRSARLQSARTWLKTYHGKSIAAGYRRHFGVDWVCAFRELEMLGVRIDSAYKGRILKSVEGHIAARQRRKARQKETHEFPFDQDETFAFSASEISQERLASTETRGTCIRHGTQQNVASREGLNRYRRIVVPSHVTERECDCPDCARKRKTQGQELIYLKRARRISFKSQSDTLKEERI